MSQIEVVTQLSELIGKLQQTQTRSGQETWYYATLADAYGKALHMARKEVRSRDALAAEAVKHKEQYFKKFQESLAKEADLRRRLGLVEPKRMDCKWRVSY